MAVIYKYKIPSSCCFLDMPVGSEILYAREQDENVFIWVKTFDNPTNTTERRYFKSYGTDEIFDDVDTRYLGSAHLHGGRLTLHIHEVFDNRVKNILAAIERKREDLDIRQGILYQNILDPYDLLGV